MNIVQAQIAGVPLYCPPALAPAVEGAEIHVDLVSGDDASDSFSLETEFGCRFSSRIIPMGALA